MSWAENAGAWILHIITQIWGGIVDHPIRAALLMTLCLGLFAAHLIYASDHEEEESE